MPCGSPGRSLLHLDPSSTPKGYAKQPYFSGVQYLWFHSCWAIGIGSICCATRGMRCVSKIILLARSFGRTNPLTTAASSKVKGDQDVIERVRQELEKSNLSIENVMAETLVLKLDEVERIDHIIAQTEARRVRILREMDRHRTALATCLREATQAIEDAEFSEVPGQWQRSTAARPHRASVGQGQGAIRSERVTAWACGARACRPGAQSGSS